MSESRAPEDPFYGAGSRLLQDEFGSRALADRLGAFTQDVFSEGDRAFIESASFFFLATSDAAGRLDCSFKGGMPGFVTVTGPGELAFPDYDGNGMFRSLGNIVDTGEVALLFISFDSAPRRLRINGTARVAREDPLMETTVGAQLIVRVMARSVFPNCPRYIPDLGEDEPAPHAPRAGVQPPPTDWKEMDFFSDVIPPERDVFRG